MRPLISTRPVLLVWILQRRPVLFWMLPGNASELVDAKVVVALAWGDMVHLAQP